MNFAQSAWGSGGEPPQWTTRTKKGRIDSYYITYLNHYDIFGLIDQLIKYVNNSLMIEFNI